MQIILVGGGVMGMGLAQGWKTGSHRDRYEVHIVTPHVKKIPAGEDYNVYPSPDDLPDLQPSMVVFAVKPQLMKDVVPLYTRYQNPDCVFVSIAAGTPLIALKEATGRDSSWVRAMPNLAVTVGEGLTGLWREDPLTPEQREQVLDLFLSVGKAFWVDSEDQIDRMTALSGSGPAYFFRWSEALLAAALEMGFSQQQANLIAQETFLGAAKLLKQGETPSLWRQRVTSPGGTTAAALAIFEERGIDQLVKEAVDAAYHRAKELGC
jgi:pyrroline-5-carboxylate reductase